MFTYYHTWKLWGWELDPAKGCSALGRMSMSDEGMDEIPEWGKAVLLIYASNDH
jgi:hypothetical protein